MREHTFTHRVWSRPGCHMGQAASTEWSKVPCSRPAPAGPSGGGSETRSSTGAGQWGSALALAARMFDLECKVYMVRVSYDQKPYRRVLMETWRASVVPSPSPDTNAGRAALAADPASSDSLGLAISEAVEDAATREDTKHSLGSVLDHVLMHQTVIGQEAKKQRALAGEAPDTPVAAAGAAPTSPASRSRSCRKSSPGKRRRSGSSPWSRWPHRASPRVSTSTTSVTWR